MEKLTAVEMMEKIESSLDYVRQLHYGLSVRDLTDSFPITTAQASQALIWLENKGILTSRVIRGTKIYDVK